MKVILTQELKGRGGEGDIVEVAHGFAVNYLLPRGIAIEATPGNVKQLEQRMHNIKKREASRIDDATGFKSALEGKTVTIAMKVGEEGRLFGSVTAPMISEAIAEQLGVEVDRRKIETHGHIKEMGEHTVDIAVYREIKAELTINVVAELDAQEATETAEEAVEVAEAVAEEAIAEGADEVAVEVEVTEEAPEATEE